MYIKQKIENAQYTEYTVFNVETLNREKTMGEQIFTMKVDIQKKDRTYYNTLIKGVSTTQGSWRLLLHNYGTAHALSLSSTLYNSQLQKLSKSQCLP